MKKILMALLETTLSMIYVATVYHISMSTPILTKINYNGRQYIEYSLKSFIFFGAAVGIYVFAYKAIARAKNRELFKKFLKENHLP